MKNLIKMISFMLLCAGFVNPMVAMEKGKMPANYNATATSTTDDGDHDWRCAICLEGLEKDPYIVTLKCCHKLHRDCMDKLLNTGTPAAKLCSLCRETHELRRNLMAVIEQMFSSMLNYDPSTIEGVSKDLVQDYQKIIHDYFQITREIFDCLSVDNLRQVYNFFVQFIQEGTSSQFSQDDAIGKLLAEKMLSGIPITREMIREEITPLFCSARYEEKKQESQRKSMLLNSLLCRLLQDQGENNFAQTLENKVKEIYEFGQNNKDALCKFELEWAINELHEIFSSENALLMAGQNYSDIGNAIADEVGISREEMVHRDQEVTIRALDQFQQQHGPDLEIQQLREDLSNSTTNTENFRQQRHDGDRQRLQRGWRWGGLLAGAAAVAGFILYKWLRR